MSWTLYMHRPISSLEPDRSWLQANSSLELLLHRLQARGSPHAAILEHVPTQLPSQAARAVAIATQATQQAQVGF